MAALLPVPVRVDFDEPVGSLMILQDVVGAGPGGALWDASLVLAQHVATSLGAEPLRGARVVELGAGCGLPSLVAARLGASVVLTDRPRALPLLRLNCSTNAVVAEVCELEWGRALPVACASPALVLAADCVAHEESFAPLLDTLLALTQQPGATAAGNGAAASVSPTTIVLLANKCRDEAEHAFYASLVPHFRVELLQEGCLAAPRDGDELPVMLYRLTRMHGGVDA